MIIKYPPIQGGVSRDSYWLARLFAEIGHEVTVVTNSFEVESEYRLTLDQSDDAFLEGNFGKGSIRLIRTYKDPAHIYIPINNPSVSKIVGLCLQAIEESRPDVIYTHYVEPFGFCAMIVSLLTGIPYIIRHAGSDVGRLMQTDQLKPAYKEVFRKAALVLNSPRLFGTFQSFGVEPHRLLSINTSYLHPDIFAPSPNVVSNEHLTLCIYGKAGKVKGSFALMRAIRQLKDKDEDVYLKARWGGRAMPLVTDFIEKLKIADRVELLPFVAQWRIPDFIHSCDVSLFLEHDFNIKIHSPSVPRELLACGSPFITTAEIADKRNYRELFVNGENCLVVSNPNDTDQLMEIILSLKDASLRQKLAQNAGKTLNTVAMREKAVQAVTTMLEIALDN